MVAACLPADPGGVGGRLFPPASSPDVSSDQGKEVKKKLKEVKDKFKTSSEVSPAQQLGLVAMSKQRKRKSEDSSDSDEESGFRMGSGLGGDRRLAEKTARSKKLARRNDRRQ